MKTTNEPVAVGTIGNALYHPTSRRPVADAFNADSSGRFLFPHEIAFLFFFLLTALRLGIASEKMSSLIFFALGFIVVGLAKWSRSRPSLARWKLRLYAYVPLMAVSYMALGASSKHLHSVGPTWLQQADQWVLGGNASVRIEAMTNPAFSDLFSFLYLGFFIYLAWSLWHYGRSKLALFQAFISGLFTIYALGFVGYTIISAAGPYLEMAEQFSEPIQGGFLTDAYKAVVMPITNRTDCFPCLHFAVSAFVLFFDLRQSFRRFCWMILPCAGIWFSTIYLRQHYFTDLLAGGLLTMLGLWIAFHLSKQSEPCNENFNGRKNLSINPTTADSV